MQGDESNPSLAGMGPRAIYEIFEKFNQQEVDLNDNDSDSD